MRDSSWYIRAMHDKVVVTDENNIDEVLERLRQKGKKTYKIKTVKSGPMLEVLIYPIWDTKNGERRDKIIPSRGVQEKLNIEKAKEKCVRYSNANFISGQHLWTTLTYDNGTLPTSIEEADKNIKNYIGRCKRYCQRNGLPPLKYIYSTEFGDKRVHHHVILNIEDMNVVEEMWTTQSERAKKRKNPFYTMRRIGRVNVRRLQEDDNGLEGLARYISKDSVKNKKKFCYSQNLVKPIEKEYLTLGGKRMSKNKIEALAKDKDEFEKVLKSVFGCEYQLNISNVKQNEFVNGYYLSAKLKYMGNENVYDSGLYKSKKKKKVGRAVKGDKGGGSRGGRS